MREIAIQFRVNKEEKRELERECIIKDVSMAKLVRNKVLKR
jgi:hypothetical protein